jgi:hypothetical protein
MGEENGSTDGFDTYKLGLGFFLYKIKVVTMSENTSVSNCIPSLECDQTDNLIAD